MLKRYHHIVGGIFRMTDALVIGGVWLISYGIRFYIPIIEVTKGFPPFYRYAAWTPMIVILWLAVFSSMRVYHFKRMLRRTHEVQLILKAHCVAMLFFIALTYLFSEYKYSRVVMIYFGLLGAILLVVFRLSLRNGLRALRKKGYNLRYVLAIGEGKGLETLIARIDRFPELGLRVIGVVTHESSQTKVVQNKQVIGHFSQIPQILKTHSVDQVLITLPQKQYGEVDRVLKLLADETINIQLVPDVHEYVTLGCEVEDFDGLPIVNLNDSPLDGWGAVLKRLTDIVLSVFAVFLFSPLLVIISLLVKLTSHGPIFYRQERMGLDGHTFFMIKFRSMKVDVENASGPVWAQPNDQRRTWLGAFLRSTSLDELPQLWNVLKGDMSLVGPRPERPIFVQQFRKEIPHYMLRHKVKSGITGWAQINGWRGSTSLSHRIEYDLYYIKNWSYFLDFKIMALTLWKGFINRNAY